MRQCFTKKHPLSGGLGLGLLLLFAASMALGQVSRTLDVGDFRYFIMAGFSNADIVYPRGWAEARSIYDEDFAETSGDEDDDNEINLDMLHAQGVCIGVKRTWTDPLGIEWVHQIAMANEEKFADIENVIVPVGDGVTRTYRNPYPTKVLDGKDWASSIAAGDPVDPSIPADVVIYSHCEAWPEYGMGIDIKRWDYGFAHEDYDDFMISEYLFTNTSGEARNDVYFALRAETSAHEYYDDADIWGNYYGVTYWKYVGGDATADSMRIWYSWDANDKAEDPDTKGRPDAIYGNFKEPQYMSFVVIHADKSPSVEDDNPRQPVKAGWSQRDLSPDLSIANHPTVYDFISKPWDPANAAYVYSEIVDSAGAPTAAGMYRRLRADVDPREHDMLAEQEKSGLFSFGPYQLAAGEDVRIVVAFAGGTIPLRWAIDLGAAYQNGFAAQLAAVPLPYEIKDPFTGETIVAVGATLDAGATPNTLPFTADKLAKDRVIDLGKKFAFANAAKAIDVWKNGTVEAGVGDFGIPLAPAAPSLEGTSENEQVRLQWGNEAEQDVEVGSDVIGYRIYRDFKWIVDLPQDTSFYLLKDENDLPAGTFEYVDTEVARGQDYFYYITAVTTDGVEGSPFLNRTGTSATRYGEALSPTRSPDPSWQENVVVVPNPYHSSAAYRYLVKKKLNFLNLPAYANIHIYTVSGDRVQTLEHVKATGDKDWERQDTFSTMEIVSGVYIYVVEELDAPGGSPTGEKAIGKFVVVK